MPGFVMVLLKKTPREPGRDTKQRIIVDFTIKFVPIQTPMIGKVLKSLPNFEKTRGVSLLSVPILDEDPFPVGTTGVSLGLHVPTVAN